MIVTPTATTSDAINPHFLFIYALLYTLHTSSMNENETRVAFQTFGIRALRERAEEKLQFFALTVKLHAVRDVIVIDILSITLINRASAMCVVKFENLMIDFETLSH